METACAQVTALAALPVPAAVTHGVAALIGAAPALVVALIGWRVNRRDWLDQIERLREQNQQLSESLRLALYARGATQ